MLDLTRLPGELAEDELNAEMNAKIAQIREDQLLTTADVAKLLNRDIATISMHARRRLHTSDPIGQQVHAGRWIFRKPDVRALAIITARGPGRPAYKFVTQEA